MSGIEALQKSFEQYFNHRHFPVHPKSLYDPLEEFLSNSGKRIRPILCLMGNELFGEINADAFHAAAAVELFHNFTLVHDDMMDAANLRRGKTTVHIKYGDNTALLVGDVMMIRAYEYIQKIQSTQLSKILQIFNTTAKEVCEGQQLDMDFENRDQVAIDEYLRMIELKTSVLLAASLQLGSMLGGATQRNQERLYEFGRKLGLAFQVQDDYLDAFGDPEKFGKQVGGDILANKKTFLLIHALEVADPSTKAELMQLMQENPADKVARILGVFRKTGVDAWALELKKRFLNEAMSALDDIAVLSVRKKPLIDLAHYLIQREH
jgi:geranylgeranyl diphosphate synthase type II